jgi:hypothetical protein
MSIDGDRNLSHLVSDRLPEFVRVDHPTLVAFLSAYYEWLGLKRNDGKVLSPMAMHDIPDIDTTLDQFVEEFRTQYLLNFPESLAISKTTNQPVDPRRLMKNIKQFYLAKGTEKSYEFLFRILYDTSVEFYYPKTDILRSSSGRWTQNNYLRISNALGDTIYRAAGNNIIQKSASGAILATARVVDVNVYQIDNFPVAELLISGRNGTFSAGNLGIDFTDGEESFHEVSVYSVVSSLTISSGGSDYEIGDRVRFVAASGDSGQQAVGTVVEVDGSGAIRKIDINDFGINYKVAPTITIDTVRGSGFSGTVTIGALCQSAGYYANNDGRLSTNKVLQDNHFYQNWSYVLKTEVVVDRYREIIRRLVHPIGTAMFGSVLIKRCAEADLQNASALMSYHVPIIGHYVPYTFQTFDDLSLWFLTGITGGGTTAAGYSPDTHDILIRGTGNGLALQGNPMTNSITFVGATGAAGATGGVLYEDNFPNGDPFWIVYPHPNKMVSRGYHIAKIWNTQITDFLSQNGGWGEWSYRKENRVDDIVAWEKQIRDTDNPLNITADVSEPCNGEINRCPNGLYYTEPYDFKYALLEYDENSEFRKITARAFFNMPQGQEFDCRNENFVNVAVPKIAINTPAEGLIANNPKVPIGTSESDYNFFRTLPVKFTIENEGNLSYYKAKSIKVYLDNKLRSTLSINTRQTVLKLIKDGRHTLRMDILDEQGRLIPGTRKIHLFAYEFVPPPQITVSDSVEEAL